MVRRDYNGTKSNGPEKVTSQFSNTRNSAGPSQSPAASKSWVDLDSVIGRLGFHEKNSPSGGLLAAASSRKLDYFLMSTASLEQAASSSDSFRLM
jgi:hypothetical protein